MKISVAMITYNHEAFIAHAVYSVLEQSTKFPFEIVIGEDCSTDRTRNILIELQKRYPNTIRLLLHDKNNGPYKNVLITLDNCQGDYIAFLDGDDYWTSSNKLQRQVEFLNDHPECSMCFHRVEILQEGGDFAGLKPKTNREKEFFTIEDIIESNQIAACSVMYRREIMARYPWSHDGACLNGLNGDTIFYVWNAQYGKVGYMKEIMGVRRMHENGIFSPLNNIEKFHWRIRTNMFMEKVLKAKYKQILMRQRANLYGNIAIKYMRAGKLREGGKYLMKCIGSAPEGRYIVSRKVSKLVARYFCAGLAVCLVKVKEWLRTQR